MEKYLISACLCGINCKYNGKNNLDEICLKLFKEGRATLVCPEQLGGLETPRDPSEILEGRVISIKKKDVTEKFKKGAEETLKIAKALEIKKAILKEGSPSCGTSYIYDGKFRGKKVKGCGITTTLLKENNIQILSSGDLNKLKTK